MGTAQTQAQTTMVGNVVMTREEIDAEKRLEAWKQSEREKARLTILERIESQKRVSRFRTQ